MSTPRLLVPLLAIPLTSCVSYWRGKDMEADIAALQGQVEQANEDAKAQRARTETALTDLEKRLLDAIANLQRGSADTGVDMDTVRDEIRKLRGELEVIKKGFEQAKGQPQAPDGGAPPAVDGGGVPPVPVPAGPTMPETEPDLYRYCYERQKADDCPEAIRACAVYAQKFPGAAQADNALFLGAECQFSKKDNAGSVRTLQTILQKYAKGDKVDDALLLMHDNFVALKRCKDALPFLETLLADYPKSNRAAEAKKKQAATKRNCK